MRKSDTIHGFMGNTAPSLNGCIEWQKGRSKFGYGFTKVTALDTGRIIHEHTHRQSWRLHFGPIPKGMQVLHKCDNPPCVNPNHLFLGTQKDNMADKTIKLRQARGERNGMAKITEEIALAIRREYVPGRRGIKGPSGGMQIGSMPFLAKKYAISTKLVFVIINGTYWKHVH